MKYQTKSVTKVVVALVAAVLMFFSPTSNIFAMGADVKEEITTVVYMETPTNPIITFYEIQQQQFKKEDLTSVMGDNETKTSELSEEDIVVETEVETLVTEKEKGEKKENVEEENIKKDDEYFIFKPDTHYIHTKDCSWSKQGNIRKITTTEDIEALACDECNPEIEIVNPYEEIIEDGYIETSNEVYYYNSLTPAVGRISGPSGEETYYNLDMSGVIDKMRSIGYSEEDFPFWVREDGVKMFGGYIMVAADLSIRPRGTIIDCSLGTAIVADTGTFIYENPYQLDIATTW